MAGVDQKCPAEIAISDRREHEISRLGLIPLIHRKNTDQAAFLGCTVRIQATPVLRTGWQGCDRIGQPVSSPALHVRDHSFRPLPEGDGAQQDRFDTRNQRSFSVG